MQRSQTLVFTEHKSIRLFANKYKILAPELCFLDFFRVLKSVYYFISMFLIRNLPSGLSDFL